MPKFDKYSIVSVMQTGMFHFFFLLASLMLSSYALAEEVPSVEPNPIVEGVKNFYRENVIHPVWLAPSIALLNSVVLVRGGFAGKQPSQVTRNFVLGTQTLAFAGLGLSGAHELFISPSWKISISLLSGAVGYLLAKHALEGNRAASVASVAIPIAPAATFTVMLLTADYHY